MMRLTSYLGLDTLQMRIMFAAMLMIFSLFAASCSGGNGAGQAVSLEELAKLREEMVARQIAARGIKDPAVLNAMRKVPRHEYVAPGLEREAYQDGPLAIGEGQTISQPYIVALMTELAKIGPESKVLEVGTGSAYQAAVLAEIAKEVYTIEIIESLGKKAMERLEQAGYGNVHVRIGDGYKGWPEAAPFDAVLVTAAPDHVPQPLIDQLKEGGRLVIPIGDYYQELEVITKTKDGIQREKIIPVRFVPMTGEAEDN